MKAMHFNISTIAMLAGAFILFGEERAGAQTQQSPVVINQPQTGYDSCATAAKHIDEDIGAISQTCTSPDDDTSTNAGRLKCLNKKLECDNQESAVASTLRDDGTGSSDCDALKRNGCPDAGGSIHDLRSDRDDARKTRDSAQKDRDDLTKQNADATQKAQDQMNQLNQQMMKDNQDYMQKTLEASQKLQQSLGDMDDQRSKAVKEAQQSYDKINAAYVEMRDTLRRKSSVVNQTTLDYNVQCRAAANSAGKDAEAAMNKRMEDENKIATNYQLRSAAGRNNRLLKRKRAKILDAYNTMLTRCLQGQDGPGVEIKSKLNTVKNDLADTTASSNDHAAVLETQRQNILSDMNQLSQSLDKKTAMMTQQNAQNMMMLQYTHQQNQGMLQQQIGQANAQAMQAQQQTQQQAQHADDRLESAKDDELLASARMKCGTNLSSSDVSDAGKQRHSGEAAIRALTQHCKSYYGDGGSNDSGSCVGQSNPTASATAKWGDISLCKSPAVKKQLHSGDDDYNSDLGTKLTTTRTTASSAGDGGASGGGDGATPATQSYSSPAYNTSGPAKQMPDTGNIIK